MALDMFVCVLKTLELFFPRLNGIYPKVYLVFIILFAIQLPYSR